MYGEDPRGLLQSGSLTSWRNAADRFCVLHVGAAGTYHVIQAAIQALFSLGELILLQATVEQEDKHDKSAMCSTHTSPSFVLTPIAVRTRLHVPRGFLQEEDIFQSNIVDTKTTARFSSPTSSLSSSLDRPLSTPCHASTLLAPSLRRVYCNR